MIVDSATTLYTTSNNYKVTVYGEFTVGSSGGVTRYTYIKCDELGYSDYHRQATLWFSPGTYTWAHSFSPPDRNATYQLRFCANSVCGSWLPANLICPVIEHFPIEPLSLTSVKIKGQFTHDERTYFTNTFQYKKGIDGPIEYTRRTSQYWPAGTNYREATISSLSQNTWYYWRYYPLFPGIAHCALPWEKFFTGTRRYFFRAFARGNDGITYYGDQLEYYRPFFEE